MLGYVVQEYEEVTRSKKRAYHGNDPPRTIIVSQANFLEMIRTYDRDILIRDSSSAVVLGENYEVNGDTPTYYWGYATRPNDYVATYYPHYLHPGDEANIVKAYKAELVGSGASEELVNREVRYVKQWGLEVPPELVKYYNLHEGQDVEVHVIRDRHLVVITKVNNCDNPDIFRFWKQVAKPGGPRVAHPIDYLPLEENNAAVEVATMVSIAPVGLGNIVGHTGSGGSGKSDLMQKVAESICRQVLKNPRMRFFVLFLGDRPEDEADYLDVIHRVLPNMDRTEYYESDWNDDAVYQVSLARWFMNRIRAITSMGDVDVIFILDSGSRWADAASDIETEGTYVKGGGSRLAFRRTAKLLGGNGYYEIIKATCTGFVTMLVSDDQFDTSEAGFATMVLNSRFSVKWSLKNTDGSPYPRVNVNDTATGTRRKERFIPEYVKKAMIAAELYRKDIPYLGAESELDGKTQQRLHVEWNERHPASTWKDLKPFGFNDEVVKPIWLADSIWYSVLEFISKNNIPVTKLKNPAILYLLLSLREAKMKAQMKPIYAAVEQILLKPKEDEGNISTQSSIDGEIVVQVDTDNVDLQVTETVSADGDGTEPDEEGDSLDGFDRLWKETYKRGRILKVWSESGTADEETVLEELKRLYLLYHTTPEEIGVMIGQGLTTRKEILDEIYQRYPEVS